MIQYIKYDHITYCEKNLNLDLKTSSYPVASRYPVRISKYYFDLIKDENDAIWKQCMPDIQELDDSCCNSPDPLEEKSLSPVPGLIHRYPDRVVILVSSRCAMYCRFCMRKRLVGTDENPMSESDFSNAVDYISSHTEINDVILSGGDPLMLDDSSLFSILKALRAIQHVKLIRIGTRIPVTLPDRVTAGLCAILRKFQPLYINTHFNHPDEITESSTTACTLLSDSGIPLGNQTVLLKGVNDSVEIMRNLMKGLLGIRVKPYYLHQMDLVQGTAHFRTPVSTGLKIISALRGHISGLAVPHFVIDLPGGKGKVALLPNDINIKGSKLLIRTYTGEEVVYEDILE
ncbi:MAG: KamA family radical SAM protein [Desulfuromonadaceae bacterium]|nr:KamA family radical SAM protein [Desulfuromonadaceae bacterium]MDD2855216.1 KamA family radical SAM protein [Desulfuromonadaceae bacterium]